MRTLTIVFICVCSVLLNVSHRALAGPVEVSATTANASSSETPSETPTTDASSAIVDAPDLDIAGSEDQENTYLETAMIPDSVSAGSNYDPAIYTGLLTPDAFQQYVNQFGAATAYAPYAPPGYPAAIAYGPPPPPLYPAPYIVQTGYEGYLVPSTSSTAGTTTTTTAAATESTTAASTITTMLLNPISVLTNLLPTLFMSTVFKVIAAVVSAIGLVLFGSAISTTICNLTPLCDISFKAVTYLRRRGTAEHMGRMIAEEMTPERIRRATEIVHSAIRKYRELQKQEDAMPENASIDYKVK